METKGRRVGYGMTSALENELLAYVNAYVEDGKYTGDLHYLIALNGVQNYNKGEQSQ